MLVTARDIIFLWVARMVMMGVEFLGELPFSDVYIHSVIQAPDGRRMSKSLGTGIDPLDEIDAHGADAVRFGLLAMSSSQDVRYSAEKVAQGQQLANKLWNASRLILLRRTRTPGAAPDPRDGRGPLDPLAPGAHQGVGHRAHRATSTSRHAALELYDFVYGELCDWYLELVKPRLYGEDADARAAVSSVLVHVLRETLALAHPIIPFVTEEIWTLRPRHRGAARRRSVSDRRRVAHRRRGRGAARAWPSTRCRRCAAGATGMGLRPGERVPARLEADGYEATAEQVARLARFEISADGGGDAVASITVPGGAVQVLATGGVDPEEADRRAQQARAKLEAEIARSEGKLSNDGFVAKAPPAVVAAERDKLERLREELAAL